MLLKAVELKNFPSAVIVCQNVAELHGAEGFLLHCITSALLYISLVDLLLKIVSLLTEIGSLR